MGSTVDCSAAPNDWYSGLQAPNQVFGPSAKVASIALEFVSLHALSSGDRAFEHEHHRQSGAGEPAHPPESEFPLDSAREMAHSGRKAAAMNEKHYPHAYHEMYGLFGWQALIAIILLLLFCSVTAGGY